MGDTPSRRPLRVLHVTTVDLSLEFLLGPVLDDAVARGWEVLAASAPGPHVASVEARGARFLPLPSSTRRFDLRADLRTARDLWRIVRRERPDVLHTHTPKPALYGRLVGRLAGVPVVVNTVHGLYAQETDPVPKRIAVYAAEFVGGHASHAELVHNPEDLETMRRYRLAPRSHLHLLGSGVSLERFSSTGADVRDRLRAEWGIEPHEVVVGSVGRLVGEKGFRELIEAVGNRAMATASTGNPPRVRLVIVGGPDADKPDALGREEIERARAAGVVFAGFRADVEAVYAALDIFVLASHREGFPRAAMEAAASGLPLVVTDIRGCRQVVEHGVNGLIVPVRSAGELSRAIDTLVADPALRARMGVASRLRAHEQFDERAVLDRIASCYAETLSERRPGGTGDPRD